MRSRDLIVLKLGGSVLRDRDALAQAVHEVYRWQREGYGVVAVVSALEGETDRLLAEARSVCDEPDAGHCAALLATGELRSAALVALALQRSGLEARALTPHQVNLRVTGAGLDAEPTGVDAARIERELGAGLIAVIPGFIGIGAEGELCTLGRGGSDLSALYIAHALRLNKQELDQREGLQAERVAGVRCRLVKDVPGLYTRDPRKPGPRAELLGAITFADALKLDGGIIQHKAVRFAETLGYEFEVGGLHAEFATAVGAAATRVVDEESAVAGLQTAPLRVVLLGLGTVGLGVYRRLCALPEQFVVTAAVCRNVSRAASQGVEPSILRASAAAVFANADILDNCDVLIEAMGGLEPAGGVVEAALGRGIHVVTANKSLVSARLPALRQIARRSGAEIRFAAAVGGAAPVIEHAERLARGGTGGGVARIEGVLNGTVNFVLDAVSRGAGFDDAVADAQRRGLAEADPTRDLSGRDAAEKLSVLSAVVTDGEGVVEAAVVDRDEVSAQAIFRVQAPSTPGTIIRQVSTIEFPEAGSNASVHAEVRVRAISADHPLARLPGAFNGAVITLRDGTEWIVRGAGAGRWPTTEAVLADCLELRRTARHTAAPAAAASAETDEREPELELAAAK